MFEGLIDTVESTIANRIFRIQPSSQRPVRVMPKQMVAKKEDIHESLDKEVQDASVPTKTPTSTQGSMSDLATALKGAKATKKATPGQKKVKMKRNDPCYCGSGKKYKKCHMLTDNS